MELAVCLPMELIALYQEALERETSPMGRDILGQIIQNAFIAAERDIPVCQDTGMVVAFVEIGDEAHVDGMSLPDAINEGIRQGYREGFLRKSVVGDPLSRVNTGDNTPAVIHYGLCAGDRIRILLMLKGFGSENMGAVRMLLPSDGKEGVIQFVTETIRETGVNLCPPVFVGIGLGGTMEMAGILSKKALFRSLGQPNSSPYYCELEETLLEEINRLGIGPGGLGGRTTALRVRIETYPTHISSLPIAVTFCCHSLRQGEILL